MILLDNNQIILANLFHSVKDNSTISEDLLRHMVLNSYRLLRKHFKDQYGELVICHDSSNCWRKQYFSNYKANRAKAHQKSEFDWDEIYQVLNKIRDEIRDVFPYKNIKIESAEADDIIAVLARKYHDQEKILIISNDKDFQQLQRYPNVFQYSTFKKQLLVCDNPYDFLMEHILRGDSSDGVPNVLSDDDVFVVEDKRQNRLTQKVITEIKENINTISNSPHYKNWDRNKTLIDFDMIPEQLENNILSEFNKDLLVTDRSKVLPYMINNRLKNLIEIIEEF
jgi:5'-3' exonuclease